jgi:hypothetical protein
LLNARDQSLDQLEVPSNDKKLQSINHLPMTARRSTRKGLNNF